MISKVRVPFTDPLNDNDTEKQTEGCRANSPDICKYYMLSSVCAFARDDHMCLQPSRSWKKQYLKLKEEK